MNNNYTDLIQEEVSLLSPVKTLNFVITYWFVSVSLGTSWLVHPVVVSLRPLGKTLEY